MEIEAKRLAISLINANQVGYINYFSVADDRNNVTDQIIIVIAVKTDENNKQIYTKLKEGLEIKAVAYPAGDVCPVCNGTGRI